MADAAVHVRRPTHARRCYGPASDAEFLRSIADKTPGRDDDRRHRQVYLKSYVFASADKEAAEAKAKSARGGRGRALIDAVLSPTTTLLPRRKQADDDDDRMMMAAAAAVDDDEICSSKKFRSRWRCPKMNSNGAGKVLSQLLTRLLSCACNPPAAAAAASSS